MTKLAREFLPGFVSLSPAIHIQGKPHFDLPCTSYSSSSIPSTVSRPPTSVTTESSRTNITSSEFAMAPSPLTPDLIILTSWTGASPRHIEKYTQGYNALYPSVPILVITTVISDLAFRSTADKIAALAPALHRLAPGCVADASAAPVGPESRPAFGHILLHAFSEGGSNKAVCLARAYLAATGRRLPVGAFVFDSTPGTPRFGNNVAAFKRSLSRNPILRFIGLPFGFVILLTTWIVFSVFIGFDNNAISKTRRALNDSRLWADLGRCPRTYLYSEADDLIDWRDVEEHGEEAARRFGVTSLLVRYKRSQHCAHAREGEGFYWNAVRRTWEARVSGEKMNAWTPMSVGSLVGSGAPGGVGWC